MRKLLAGLCGLLLLCPVFAGEVETLLEPKAPLTKNILLVVDTSGSMEVTTMVPTMLGFVEMVTQQPIDDMRLAVIAFDSAPYRWDGVPDEENKIPKGWAALPSKEAVDDAQSFIISNLHDRFTYFSSPVLAALDEPVNDLSIILVTDGKPTMPHEITTLLSEVTARQAIREEKGLGKAVIYTVFIGVGNVDWLKVLSEGNGGGYFRTHD